MALLLCTGLLWGYSLRNWQVFTNTTHIYTGISCDEGVFLGTWGGFLGFSPSDNSFSSALTPIDGLSEMHVKSLDYLPGTRTFLIGTRSNGVDRYDGSKFLIPISENSGLLSDDVQGIAHNDSLIFVATSAGISVFSDNDDFPYPMIRVNLTVESGLLNNNVRSIAISNGYLLAGSAAGLDIVAVDSLMNSSAWHHYTRTNSELPYNKITAISAFGDGFSVGTERGLMLAPSMNPTTWTVPADSVLSATAIYRVLRTDSGTWVAIGAWDEDDFTVVNSIGTPATFITDEGIVTKYDDTSGLGSPLITGFINDGSTIYATSWGAGIYRFDGTAWHLYTPNGPSSNVSTIMTVDHNGVLWTGDGNQDSSPSSLATSGLSSYNGSTWTNYNFTSSGLRSNNVVAIGIDTQNRKWIGTLSTAAGTGWRTGLSLFNDATNTWSALTTANGLTNNTISFCEPAPDGTMWVGTYGGNSGRICIVDMNLQSDYAFMMPIPGSVYSPYTMYFGEEKRLFSDMYKGLRIYNSTDIPSSTTDDAWYDIQIPNDINGTSGRPGVIRIASRQGWYGEEFWFTCEKGLFRFDGYNWYRMSVSYKREMYNFSSHEWTNQELYYSDEKRLYGASATTPNCILIDPFDRVWIGSQDNGLTLYDPATDRYTIFNMANCPLISNTINALAYNPTSGRLYVGTNSGLCSVEIGRTTKTVTELNKPRVFPNPFYPGAEVGGNRAEVITISNGGAESMPIGSYHCRIYDLAGELVVTLDENLFGEFTWNGQNKAGKDCSSGMYHFVIYGEGKTKSGSFAIIR
jgi:ligand-binding sensor domain-containing protein